MPESFEQGEVWTPDPTPCRLNRAVSKLAHSHLIG